MWTLYDRLIAHARERAGEDAVAYAVQGENWMLVKTAAGRIGVAATHPTRTGKRLDCESVKGMPVAQAAALVKSWDFERASFGLACINAVINDPATLPVTENPDAFLRYKDLCLGKKVAVIGRFAYLESRLEGLCDLHVLERLPGDKDYPDAACEYLLPDMDVVFITGCTVSNKTLPRLLQLAKNAFTIISGPSTPMDELLLAMGADALCGFCVTDEAAALRAANDCAGLFASGRMVCIESPLRR